MVALDSFYPMTGVTEQLAQWQKFAPSYYGDGVVWGALATFTVGQHAPPGMNVDVSTGRCFIQGVFGESGSTKTLTIAAADATNPRIDRVVLRLDTVAQNIQVLVITGTPAVSPSAPALVRSATQTDYSLCQVLVGTTVTSIVTANITDETQWASPRGLPHNSIASSTTLHPYGSSSASLTEGMLWSSVSGTTTITSIDAAPQAGAILILNFSGAGCTLQKGNNIALTRNYVSGSNSAAIALVFDATNWFEIGRSGEQAPANQYYGNPTGTASVATFAAITVGDLPTLTTWTPGLVTQGGITLTMSAVSARQWQAGKFVFFNYRGSIGTVGTSGSAVLVNLPAGLALVSATNFPCVGSFIYNRFGITEYAGSVQALSTTQLAFVSTANDGALGSLPAFATASGDLLSFVCMAELA